MRIISGFLKGRQIKFPNIRNEAQTRPTTDYARESLLNILQNWIDLEDAHALDLFAGSGAMGIEFISRGAAQVTFVEKSNVCLQSIQEHIKLFDIQAQSRCLKADVFPFIEQHAGTYDLIFADPPYQLAQLGQLPTLILQKSLLKPSGLLVVEHSDRHHFENNPQCVDVRHYGQAHFSFFQPSVSDAI